MHTNARRHRLDSLFRPRSIAVIGGSDRNPYSHLMHENLVGLGFDGRVHVVNQRGVPAHGYPGVKSCAEIGEPVDAAVVIVPGEAVMDVMSDAVAAGIRNFVIVSSGFAELGAEGRERQQKLREFCLQHSLNVLGPNCLGFQNHVDRVGLGGVPYIRPQNRAGAAIVSASGAVATYMGWYAAQQGLGVNYLFATGNEMGVTTTDVIDALIEDEHAKGFLVFMETVADAERFADVAERARAARKPIVVIKVGAAPSTAAVAAAHTGALVGDDKVFDAVCERYGVVRTSTFEECITTAGVIMEVGPIRRRGVGALSISGGNCEVISDLCAQHGVPLPAFSAETTSELRKVISHLGNTLNPLDLTGHATRDFTLWASVPRAISGDPNIGLTVINCAIPNGTPYMAGSFDHIGEALRTAHTPVLLVTNTANPVNEHGREFMAKHDIGFVAPGLDFGVRAIGKLFWWSERVERTSATRRPAAQRQGSAARPTSEREVLDYLASCDVPVIRTETATSAAEAVAAARRIGGPVALKIVSPDIPHKTDVGGVKLNVSGDDAVREAYEQILSAVKQAKPQARIDGVSVAPFRTGGVEILVGVARDPQWGLVMALGLGGVWVEALQDTALRLLPIEEDDAVRALESLRGAKLFKGFRGAPPVDLRRVAQAAVRIGDAALALGPELQALEINPLLASVERVEALDALAVWK